MAFIKLTVRRKNSKYFDGVKIYLNTDRFLEFPEALSVVGYKTQAEEDAKTPTGTYIEYTGFVTKETYVVDETPAEIEALASVGGSSTPFPIGFNETIWYDSTGTLFIRRTVYDDATGTSTITDYEPDGVTPYTPTEPITPFTDNKVETESASFAVTVVIENPTNTTTYVGYSTQQYVNGSYNLALPQWSIMKMVEQSNGSTTKSFANGLRFSYGLVFNSGANEYLGYTYTN